MTRQIVAALAACGVLLGGCGAESQPVSIDDAVALVDVRLLDHFVVGDGEVVSFAERGWL